MRKSILKTVAIMLLGVMLCMTFVSCNGNNEECNNTATTLSGKYSNVEGYTGLTLEFTEDGKVSVQHLSTARVDLEAVGTYTITDGKITIAYTERTIGTAETAEKWSFTDASLETGEGFIKINGKEYKAAAAAE